MHWDKVASLWQEYKVKKQQVLHLRREKDRIKKSTPVDLDRIEEIDQELARLDIRISKIEIFVKSIR